MFGLDEPKKKRTRLNKSQRIRLRKSQDGKCNQCGDPLSKYFQVDHKNGDSSDNGFGNLQALCGTCHAEKSGKENERRNRERTNRTPSVLRGPIGKLGFDFGNG